ncbi:MAG TPA: fumarylacetoacetate hydrolase family protein [Gordonia sp. (in: high G+C Gram-positive bacteria)]|uniref:fumarylacetoacetate hydrolase family protein n=1 Tax=unclassified Gordonia (in: high G+C Gram-positive bacteria) TaxID=2657482 RepID=UPI000F967DA8|nr:MULTISPECIES: fumarylacetoacetate hydrolase family protein [unclassified Gordonia (in: high G+C Gram-positive bacteria)]RUP38621.1 MAG: fumarylacetoacetate hydrolase family protein [Gordonia sp. (in: high G+C Gram-positive bacteria)]HNP56230.1 fumarylacetoacetate hydrolase family protein [Gordonia sp. (in: high G+C Gram-positive bacteria)]HRC51731.1 fumarylacetoacetate hydrolase family protein [Gordonia sp. (in: high G+C Gram-positive bacteria)]
MSIAVLRTVDSWWVRLDEHRARKIGTTAQTTTDLLADRTAIEAALDSDGATAEVEELSLVSPVTTPCRVVAQMTNYATHVRDSGMDPATVPLTFFRKASGSITGPQDEVIKPAHVGLLDYEVEIGLVIGETIPLGTSFGQGPGLPSQVAALVITNDVSARDVQLPKTQFYEAKSYPTFTPVGPVLLILEDGDGERFVDLRLQLHVNGEVRQDSTVADMIYRPHEALACLTRFQHLDVGDLVLTGTPGGTALKAPAKPLEIIGNLMPPALKWKTFFKRQASNPKYLHNGDIIEASIGTADKVLDLGVQRNPVRYAK